MVVLAQLVRALVCGTKGRRFEPGIPPIRLVVTVYLCKVYMHSERPYIICHMMQPIDGKIATGVPDKEFIMDFFDVYTQTEQQLEAKVWLFGRKTASAFGEPESTPLSEVDTDIPEADYVVTSVHDTYAVVVDGRGVLRWNKNYIHLSNQENDFQLVTIVSAQTPKQYLQYLKNKKISYITCGDQEIDFNHAMIKLKKLFNIEKMLLEGGGSFNGSMMNHRLIDEISLLLLPRVLNKKNAPSLFDFPSTEVNTTNLALQDVQRLRDDVLWLRYLCT